MTPLDFGYWIRGLMTDQDLTAAQLAQVVLAKAAEILDKRPVKAAPPQMRAIPVQPFCIHNVHLNEPCQDCITGSGGSYTQRYLVFKLSKHTPQVYIPLHGDPTSGDSTDSGTPEAAERT